MDFKEIIQESNKISVDHGFWKCWDDAIEDEERFNNLITTKVMLAVTELSEAVEGLRKDGLTENFTEELADAIIRISDLAEQLDLPLEEVLIKKQEKNKTRPHKHGKKF